MISAWSPPLPVYYSQHHFQPSLRLVSTIYREPLQLAHRSVWPARILSASSNRRSGTCDASIQACLIEKSRDASIRNRALRPAPRARTSLLSAGHGAHRDVAIHRVRYQNVQRLLATHKSLSILRRQRLCLDARLSSQTRQASIRSDGINPIRELWCTLKLLHSKRAWQSCTCAPYGINANICAIQHFCRDSTLPICNVRISSSLRSLPPRVLHCDFHGRTTHQLHKDAHRLMGNSFSRTRTIRLAMADAT